MAKAGHLKLPIEMMERGQMDQLCFAQKHQGCALLHESFEVASESLASIVNTHGHRARILILAHIQDPHNLGACLRTACAAGVHAVILTKHESCMVNETVIKVASGAVSHLAIFTVTNLSQTLAQLKTLGVWIYGTSEHATDSL